MVPDMEHSDAGDAAAGGGAGELEDDGLGPPYNRATMKAFFLC